MSRSVPWRRACPDTLSRRMDETFQTVMYIVHQAGPTGFVLKHEDKKFKVFLGDPHSCTCPIFKKEKDLCVHILWLLLKKFRIPKKNQIVYQFGLIEREIHEVINGYLTQQSPRQEEATVPSLFQQRPVSQDDVCPICQDELMSEKPQRLTHCKHGCGQNVHLKCIKVWAEHQKSQGEKSITCPLCRETFSSFEELKNELQFKRSKQNNLARKTLHFDTYCSQCEVCPISGRCYKCAVCVDVYLCHSCFVDNHHAHHLFHFRQDSTHPWRPAPRCTSLPSPLPQSFIDDIQTRELHENDYEALLRLDTNATISTATHQHDPLITPSVPQYILYSFKSEPLNHNHPLILLGSACFICNETFIRGDWIRKLPCKHKV
jgi:E3 ubiquitin-protein ligase ZSWIM2